MPEATVQAHRAQGEAWVKLHLEMLVPESTVVAAVTNQVWQAQSLDRQSWPAREAALTGTTLQICASSPLQPSPGSKGRG